MSLQVERFEDISMISRDEWEAVVQRAGASTFFSWNAVSAYAQGPLLPALQVFYFVVREDSGAIRAVLPAYLQEDVDPFGLLAPHIPGFDPSRRRGLLTHFWHCYDTVIAGSEVDSGLAQCVVQALEATAKEQDADCYGFINVPAATASCVALKSTCLEALPIWARFQLRLPHPETFDAYLLNLPSRARRELQRQLRRAAESDAICRVETLPFARLDEAVQLCHATAARRGTGFYYEPQRLKSFLLKCGAAVRIVCVYLRGELLCAFICLADADRLHVWAGGARYDLSRFSPYVIAFAEAIRYAIENGYAMVEGGRGNGAKKESLGFQPLPLYAFVRLTSGRTRL